MLSTNNSKKLFSYNKIKFLNKEEEIIMSLDLKETIYKTNKFTLLKKIGKTQVSRRMVKKFLNRAIKTVIQKNKSKKVMNID